VRARIRLLLALAAAAALACGGAGGSSSPAGPAGLPRNTWTWVDLPGTECSDGSQTGIAVSPGDRDDVVVFLDGGGACWDTLTCFTIGAANPGPYVRASWEAERDKRIPGSFLDRTAAGNPFAEDTLVFVPYCTGDVHTGDTVQSYPGAPRPWHHKGRVNVQRALDWIAGAITAPPRLVVSGASAGGFGSLLAFDVFRRRFPAAKGYLVDDSGPLLVGDDINPAIRAAWFASWRLDEILLPICERCAVDLSALFPALSSRYPGDRLALLSSTRDAVIRSFFLLTPTQFEGRLLRLANDVIAPLPNVKTFLVPGETHTMIGAPARFTAGGVGLVEWLRREVEDDPAWGSVGP
jgi:hypothetical protein